MQFEGGRRSNRCGTRLGLAVVLVSAMASAADAQTLIAASRFYKAVNPGGFVEITKYFAIDPQCRSEGSPVVNLLAAPHGGQVETGPGRGFPSFPASNIRMACNRKKVPGTLLVYRAAADFSGTDTFDVEVQYPDGFARKYRYAVIVR